MIDPETFKLIGCWWTVEATGIITTNDDVSDKNSRKGVDGLGAAYKVEHAREASGRVR